MSKNTDFGLLVLRIVVGALMLLHGIAKLKGVSFIEGRLESVGLPSILAYGVYITEIVAPLMLIIGYKTRLASLVFAIGMLSAILLVHTGDILTRTGSGGWGIELQALFLFGAIALFYTGGGKYAVNSGNKWD